MDNGVKKINFVVPDGNSSGGIRVTMEMANNLLNEGHIVRIFCKKTDLKLPKRMLRFAIKVFFCLFKKVDWLDNFRGKVLYYKDLNLFTFDKNECVIAVGTYTIEDVYRINSPVIKIRYCHGFSEHLSELNKKVWKYPMHTISVSPQLIEEIKEKTGHQPIGVVQNAINHNEYFDEKLERVGIGTIYNSNPKKAPLFTINLINRIVEIWPDIPFYVFSSNKKPVTMSANVKYYQLPNVAKCRHIYNKCKIWLIGSHSEGFCLPILEAMACGTAVISTDHDTVRGIVTPGSNAILVPIDGENEFIEKIELLLKNDDLRESLIQNGFEKVKEFTWKESSMQMIKVLNLCKGNVVE